MLMLWCGAVLLRTKRRAAQNLRRRAPQPPPLSVVHAGTEFARCVVTDEDVTWQRTDRRSTNGQTPPPAQILIHRTCFLQQTRRILPATGRWWCLSTSLVPLFKPFCSSKHLTHGTMSAPALVGPEERVAAAAGRAQRTARLAASRRALYIAIAVLAAAALGAGVMWPRARAPLGAATAAAVLLFIRSRYFGVPGVGSTPFSKLRKLLSTTPAAPNSGAAGRGGGGGSAARPPPPPPPAPAKKVD